MLKSEEKPLTLLENPIRFIHTHTHTHTRSQTLLSEFKYSIEFRYLRERYSRFMFPICPSYLLMSQGATKFNFRIKLWDKHGLRNL